MPKQQGHLFHLAKLSMVGFASVFVTACGGGGGGSTDKPATAVWPSSGSYEVVLKPTGSTSASSISAALSLVHASKPDTEYLMDEAAASSQIGITLLQGQFNSTTGQITGLQTAAYVDNRNGTLRVTSLVANGSRPNVSTTNVASLCGSSLEARNFITPYASQILASTAGTDGLCNTSDDGQLLIKFADSGTPTVSSVPATNRFLGYLRSKTTGQPTDWLVAWSNGQIDLWPMDQSHTTIIKTATTTNNYAFSSIGNLSDLILYTQNGLLKAMRMVNGTASTSNVSALTGLSGWALAGNDGSNAYAYMSSGSKTSCSETWRITSISRTSASASTLATGSGSLLDAMVLNGAVYASVCSPSGGSLIKVDTATRTQTVLRTSGSSVYTATSFAGELAVSAISSTTGSWSLNFLDASGNLLYDAGNAMPYGGNQTIYDVSSNTFSGDSVYVVPQTLFTTGVGGTMRRWAVASNAMHTIGTLPSATDLGGSTGNAVFVFPSTPSGSLGGTYTARVSSNQQIQASGSRVYTFLPTTDNSLMLTTKQVR